MSDPIRLAILRAVAAELRENGPREAQPPEMREGHAARVLARAGVSGERVVPAVLSILRGIGELVSDPHFRRQLHEPGRN